MEATERRNYPYYIILGYMPPKGTLGILVVAPSDGDCNSLILDASLAIPTRVLRFEVSQRARIPSTYAEPLVLALWLNQGTPTVLW
jgi:hypothetical protein